MSFLKNARQNLLIVQQLLVYLLCYLLRLLGDNAILIQRCVKDAIATKPCLRLLAHIAFLLGKCAEACHGAALLDQVLALSIQTLKAALLDLLQLV